MKKLAVFGAALAAAVLSFSSFGGTLPVKFVEYVETAGNGTTGTQWLRLDYTPSSKATFEFEAALVKNKNLTHNFFCARGNLKVDTFTLFWLANKGLRWDYNATNGGKYNSSPDLKEKFSVRVNGGGFFYNDVKDANLSYSTTTFTAGGRLMLFASYETSDAAPTGNFAAIRLYSFKAMEGDRTICDLWPCVDETGVAGLYDTVSEKILYSMGTEDFAAGGKEVEGPLDQRTLPIPADTLRVHGWPFWVGTPDPAYGLTADLAAGDVTCTAPEGCITVVEGKQRASVAGWTHETLPDGKTATFTESGEGTTCTFAHTAGNAERVTWNWAFEHVLSVESVAGGSVSGDTGWIAHGDEVTLTAVPAEGKAFRSWAGEGAAQLTAGQRLSPTITFAVTKPMFLRPVFGGTFEVSTEAELKAALGEASETGGDEIIIAANTTIKLTAAITVEKPVTIRGAAEREDTILSANSKNYHVIEMKHPDAVLKNVTLTGSKVGYNVKGGLIMSGGLVTNVVITGNIGNGTDTGPLVYLTGGRLTGSLITGNEGGHRRPMVVQLAGTQANYLAGLGPEVDHCQIVDNKMQSTTGQCFGAVRLDVGYVHDCLIARNSCGTGYTAGVYVGGGGVLANCTVVGNKSGAATAGGIYWNNQSEARIVNCIFSGNESTGGNCDWGKASTAKDADLPNVFLNCLFDGSDIGGTNCKVGDPNFNNPGEGDYTLTSGSDLARENGLAKWKGIGDQVTFALTADDKDLAENPRIMGDKIDMGAYEYDPNQFAVAFSSDVVSGSSEMSYQLTSEVAGASGPVEYAWTFLNLKTGTETYSTDANPLFQPTEVGVYTVSLTVGDGVHQPLTVTKNSYISALSVICYVDPDSETPAYPYNTQATAAKTIPEAYDACADGGEVVLAKKTIKFASTLNVERPLTIRGEGERAETILQITKSGISAVHVNHSQAVLWNLTITGASGLPENAGALNFGDRGGLVTNCVVRGNSCSSGSYCGPGGVYMAGGRITGSLITGNTGGSSARGVAMRLENSNALVDHCLIATNVNPFGVYGIILANAGTMDNCVIADNGCTGGNTAGLYVSGSVTIRNCTITKNDCGSGNAGGLYWTQATGARIVNCIISGNSSSAGKSDWTKSGDGQDASLPDVFQHCLFGNDPVGTEPQSGDPAFRNAALGDYSLTSASAARGNGTTALGIGETDFAGNPRVNEDGSVDIGAYQYQVADVTCGIVAGEREGFPGQTFALTSVVEGVSGVVNYSWRIANGDIVLTPTEANPFVTLTEPGRYDVELTVTATEGTASDSRPGYLYVVPRDIYVAWNAASPEFPFNTPQKAANNAIEAVDAARDGCTIHVSGTNEVTGTISISRGITLAGETGRDTDRIHSNNKQRVIYLNNAQAVVKGLAIVNGGSPEQYYNGSGMLVGPEGGLVEDCLFMGNKQVHPNGYGAALSVSGPVTVRRCIFRGNATAAGGHGGAVSASAGCFENCLFDGNEIGDGWGSAVYVTSADVTLRNCTFVGNHGGNSGYAVDRGYNGAIFFTKAALETPGLEIVNCLFDGNYLKTTADVANWNVEPGYDADNLAAAFTTCAFTAGELPVADDETKAMLVADPGFTDDGTYRLTKKTALRGKGTYEAWMDGATDLYGHFRANALKEVAVGCCEPDPILGLQIIVR